MPGLFGVFPKKNLASREFRATFEDMQKSLNFFNYGVETYTDEAVLLGTIGPGKREPICTFLDGGKEYIALLDGHIFSIAGQDAGLDLSTVFKAITHALVSGNHASVATINGEYNIFLYNRNDNILYLISDRFGFKTIYFTESNNAFFFFPDFYAVKKISGLKKEINNKCIIDHINFTVPLNNDTFLKNVHTVPSANIITIRGDNLSCNKQCYWDWHVNTNSYDCRDINDYADMVHNLLKQGVNRRCLLSKHRCASLSGGMDSRLLVSLLESNNNNPSTLTYGYEKSYEAKIARKVAKVLQLKNEHVSIDDDYVFKEISIAIKVTDGIVPALQLFHLNAIKKYCLEQTLMPEFHFSGFYGGAILGAHYFDINDRKKRSHEAIAEKLLQHSSNNIPSDIIKTVFNKWYAEDVINRKSEYARVFIDRNKKQLKMMPLPLFIDRFFAQNHGRRYLSSSSFFRLFCHDTRPFFDYNFFDFYLAIPVEYRLRHRLYSLVFERYFPLVSIIPYNKTGRIVGEEPFACFVHKKQYARMLNYYLSRLSSGRIIFNEPYNYVQFDKWFLSIPKLIKKAFKLLLEEQTLDRSMLDPDGIRHLYSDYKKGKWVAATIVNLYFLEKWFRVYIDGEKCSGI